MKIWFDITNTPQVHFLLGIKSMLEGNNSFIFSTREFSETTKLLILGLRLTDNQQLFLEILLLKLEQRKHHTQEILRLQVQQILFLHFTRI